MLPPSCGRRLLPLLSLLSLSHVLITALRGRSNWTTFNRGTKYEMILLDIANVQWNPVLTSQESTGVCALLLLHCALCSLTGRSSFAYSNTRNIFHGVYSIFFFSLFVQTKQIEQKWVTLRNRQTINLKILKKPLR